MKKTLTISAAKGIFAALLFLTFNTSHAQDNDYSRIRLVLNGGWGYRFAKTSPDVSSQYENLIKGMRSGAQFGGDLMVYLNESFGVGVKYNRFSTSSQSKDSSFTSKLNTGTDFYGAMVGGRIYNKNYTGAFIVNLALGYLRYTENGLLQEGAYRATGGTVGSSWEIGYDFKITQQIAVGAQITYMSGALRTMTFETANGRESRTFPDGQAESMARIGITGGIRFTL